jgi:hypothetical protein
LPSAVSNNTTLQAAKAAAAAVVQQQGDSGSTQGRYPQRIETSSIFHHVDDSESIERKRSQCNRGN